MKPEIGQFEGPYHFLSNFSTEGGVRPTVEHHYQAAKTESIKRRVEILQAPSPGQAKKMGNDRRRTKLVEGFDEGGKLIVMEMLLIQKFEPKIIREKLLATGEATLIEGNYWGDTYWGVCNEVGENHLGRLLEKVRALYAGLR